MSSQSGSTPRSFAALFALTLLLLLLGLKEAQVRAATAVFINEIHYDNIGGDIDEAVEIAGPAATDLSGWKLHLYNGSSSQRKVYDEISLGGLIPDFDNGFGTLYFPAPGIQNGAPDGLALTDNTGALVQFLCYEGAFEAVDGPAAGQTCVDIGVSEGSSTPIGYSLQLAGTGTLYEDFTWNAQAANTYGQVNGGQSFGGVSVTCGSTLWFNPGHVTTREVSATDISGIVVDFAIASTTPVPSLGSITVGNVVPAATAGEEATAEVIVDADVPQGSYVVTVSASTATDATGSCALFVEPILTIGQVQGVVGESDWGPFHRSPFAPPYSPDGQTDDGEIVTIQGVVYEKTQEYRSSGGAYYGFFVQNTTDIADGDPHSSDGIFVFQNYFPTLLEQGGGFYSPEPGDEIILRGPVQERYSNTRLNNPYVIRFVRDDIDLDAEIPAFVADPPDAIVDDTTYDDLGDAYRYWERREGMRGQVPEGSIVLNGRDVFASSFDSEVWVARGDALIAGRSEPYQRRSFRDVHPLDDIPTVSFDNENPYRILIGAFGVKAAWDDTTALLTPARTFDTLDNAPTGGVYYNFGKYAIEVEEQPVLSRGVDPSLNGTLNPIDIDTQYSVVVYNVENLYDYVDDAFDGCDFNDWDLNPGCAPDVDPPYDYVPLSDAAYQQRLAQLASQIINDLLNPDIILVQEVEDQDVCSIISDTYVCPPFSSQANNADGKPDTLQELAQVIANLGGPVYDVALDRDGGDDRGIVSGYLYRTDRVELLPPSVTDPVLGDNPSVVYDKAGSTPLPYNNDVQNPKVLNATLPDSVSGSTDGDNVFTRPPQVGLFRIWRDAAGESVFQDVYLLNNHFSSGPDRRVDQRTEQAAYNAAIVDALQRIDAEVYASVGGDLNVYPRPDDPFPSPSESDQLADLYNRSLINLWDRQVAEDPDSAYTYIYLGQAQTLDQMFVAPAWFAELAHTTVVHINADFPADYPTNDPRGVSDHDPVYASYNLMSTVGRLQQLVLYFETTGDISGNNTATILFERLERAERYQELGQTQSYVSMIGTFINQVEGFTPNHISRDAADVLIAEVRLLLP